MQWRKGLIGLAAAIGLMAGSGAASAAYIVDTGTPDNAVEWSVYSNQWFGAKFSLASKTMITSIEGYLADTFGNDAIMYVTIRPGSGLPLWVGEFDPSSTLGWQGLYGLDLELEPDTYWVLFEPTQFFGGVMPGNAPDPLEEYVVLIDGAAHSYNEFYSDGGDFDLGIRLGVAASVPAPGMAALLLAGLGGAAFARRWRR